MYILVLSCCELGIFMCEYLIDVIEKIECGWLMKWLVEFMFY